MNKWECNIESNCACPTIFTIHHKFSLISMLCDIRLQLDRSLIYNTHIQIYSYFVKQNFKTYIFIYIYSNFFFLICWTPLAVLIYFAFTKTFQTMWCTKQNKLCYTCKFCLTKFVFVFNVQTHLIYISITPVNRKTF